VVYDRAKIRFRYSKYFEKTLSAILQEAGLIMTVFISRILFALAFFATFLAAAGNDKIAEQVENMSRQYDKKYSTIRHVTVAAYLKEPEKWVLVDVRSAKERSVSIISGSITAEMLEKNLDTYKNKHILVYCTIGERSSAYAAKLLAGGYKHVANLRGGVLAWALAGKYFITSDKTKTRKVHVYASAWNVLPATYTGVW
jgi:rhodanese-related sulfurtransferase